LLKAPDRTDVFVMTDGSHGFPGRPIEEEAAVRRAQFEAEMEYAGPRSWKWLGIEDTKLAEHQDAADQIDFTVYTKIFLPWIKSLHPDHRAAAQICRTAIRKQKAEAECFSYEVNAPFYTPTHFADLTGLEDEKRRLAAFHEDQAEQPPITLSLNRFRAAQMLWREDVMCAECYLKIDPYDLSESPDLLVKLYEINDDPAIMQRMTDQGIQIKRVMPMNTTKVYDFIKDNFAATWADECLPSILRGDCYVAVKDRQLLGFFAIETPAKGFTGPIGVLSSARRMGISRALGLTGIKAMKAKGYKYAVSGRVHPWFQEVEKSIVGVEPIPNCAGSYYDMI
jgi:LmbE family N-acetylglucosaminyl deacetylase